jgi:hypothetical protein
MAAERESPTPADQVARLYEQAETQAAKAGEHLVGSGGFASLLGQLAENAAALSKLTSDGMDLVLRNLRVAGRRDVVRLSRQLARTEDKLERVLQELEEVKDQLTERETPSSPSQSSGPRRAARSNRAGKTNGSAAKQQRTGG